MGKLLVPNIVANGVLWLVGLAMQISGWVSQSIAIGLLVIAGLWTLLWILWWWRKNRHAKHQEQKDESLKISIRNSGVGYIPATNQPMIIVEVDLKPSKKMQLAKISLEYEGRLMKGIMSNLALPHYLEQDETLAVMFETDYKPSFLLIREGLRAKANQPRSEGKLKIIADTKEWESPSFLIPPKVDNPAR